MEGFKVKVDTRWFGTVDIDDDKIITFDLGIIGFENCKKFTLIYDNGYRQPQTALFLPDPVQ